MADGPVLSAPDTRQTNASLVVRQMFCGSLARATAATLLIPLDTCKTRLQFQGAMSDAVVRRYSGLWDAFKAIWKEEGLIGFYRGLPPRLLYIGPAAGIRYGWPPADGWMADADGKH